MTALPFYRVVVSELGSETEFSPEEFLKIPLRKRIRAILESRATFYSTSGEVDPQVALKALHTAARPA